MTIRTYRTPAAFKQALELRLRTKANTAPELARTGQLLIFDRFLARIVELYGDSVILKGGLVLELRLERARTTKDIDLRVSGNPDQVLETLQVAAMQDMTDFMTFEVKPDRRHPEILGDGVKYEGMRFNVVCQLAGKLYGQPFGVDVAFGDPIHGEVTKLTGKDYLGFAGVAPPQLRAYPIETHIAEKLHAFTMPRRRPNSRVKDLPDIALLASTGNIEATSLRAALS